jgi:hypothetical protein
MEGSAFRQSMGRDRAGVGSVKSSTASGRDPNISCGSNGSAATTLI